MRFQFLIFPLIVAFAATAAGAAFAAESAPAPKPQVTYVSGGVGEDSLERVQAAGKDFNLKLLFALKAGSYVADVLVTIRDTSGKEVLDTVSEGPFLYAKLAAGKYEITATYDGESVKRTTTIPVKGNREVVFRWDRAVERAAD